MFGALALRPAFAKLRRRQTDAPDKCPREDGAAMVAHLRRDGLEFTVGVFEEFLGALDADVGEMLHRSAAEFAAASPVLTPEIVKATFDLHAALAARGTTGAPSPENIQRELSRWREQLR